MSKTTVAIGILCAFVLSLMIGVFVMADDIGWLKTQISLRQGESEYIIEKAERDARMLNATIEMLDFVQGNLDAMNGMVNTYRITIYDMSIRIRELENE